MKKIGDRLHANHLEIIVLIVLFLFSLRVINWFEQPYILISGDLRPPLVHGAFVNRFLYTWNEIDFGLPSIYSPRILDPYYFFITILQSLGIGLYLSEIITVFSMFFLTSVCMYIFAKQLTNGDKVASLVAALYLTSNLYLINDREVSAIGFTDTALVILPCLITFVVGIKKKSFRMTAISGILCTLTYANFPNYRTTLICLVMLGILTVFYFASKGLHFSVDSRNGSGKMFGMHIDVALLGHYLKLIAVFVTVFLSASIWVGAIVFSNFTVLSGVYAQLVTPWFAGGVKISDVTRLIVKWSFFESGLDKPYLPYGYVYSGNPLIIVLCYLPAILAFASLLLSKKHKITLFFSCVAIISILMTSGFSFNEYMGNFYSVLIGLPFFKVFREASNWVFFVIVSFSILIGLTSSAVFHRLKNKLLQIFTIGLVALLFITTAYPLVTGEVTSNWLSPNIKGAYLPPFYVRSNELVSNQYWTLLLPQRYIYVSYNFSGVTFACGNPYPLIFLGPTISGLGTEYIKSGNLDLINRLYELMLTSGYENVASEGTASASSVEKDGLVPALAIDEDYNSRWASAHGMPQWLEIDWNKTQELSKTRIAFQEAYANDYTIETWNGSNWTIQVKVENNTSLEPEYMFSQLTPGTKLRINFTKASPFNMTSIFELDVLTQKDGAPKFLGMLGIKNLVVEKDLISGNLSEVKDLRLLNESRSFSLIHEWEGVSLYENEYTLEKLYPADNILLFSNLDELYQLIDGSAWSAIQHSAFVNSTSDTNWASQIGTLGAPESFSWTEVSPTSYKANVKSNAKFLLVFLESYDPHWAAFVNGRRIPESNHVEINAFANGWLIDALGNVTITVEYETQSFLTASIAASVVLPSLFMMFLVRNDLKAIASNILCRLRKRKG